MCVALEDTNPNVNSHLLSATHFSHSTMTSLNVLQTGGEETLVAEPREKICRYDVGVLPKPIGTFLLLAIIFHQFFSSFFFSTEVLV